MIWYVAVIAVLNIGVGYGLAVYMGAARQRNAVDPSELASYSLHESDEFEDFDDGDDADAADYYDTESLEYETATVG